MNESAGDERNGRDLKSDRRPADASNLAAESTDALVARESPAENRGPISPKWPFVGRRAELEHVCALISTPGAGGVVLVGAAGMGKTRLAVECLHAAQRGGYPTDRVSATKSTSHLPFGAIAPLLPGKDSPTSAYLEFAELLRWMAVHISRRGQGKRLVLMVDDAHFLDESSAVLIHQLAEARSVFVLATVLSSAAPPGAISFMCKDGAAERLEIAPLALHEAEALLKGALGGSADGPGLRFLATRSEGNPLFLQELVLAARDAKGALVRNERGGVLVGAPPPSPRLTELVESRIQGLSTGERHVLELVAFGEALGAYILTSMADPETIERLERRQLIAVAREGRRLEVRLAHSIHGDVLRHRSGVLRATAVTRALADALEGVGTLRREDPLRVAVLRLAAGGTGNADLMLRAAREALTRHDVSLAERLLAAAREGGGDPVEAALLSGQLLFLQGRCEEAEERLAPLAARLDNDIDRAGLAALRIDNLWYGRGKRDEAMRVARDAESAIADTVIGDIVLARRAGVLGGASNLRAALELTGPLLARASGAALAWASHVAVVSLVQAGRPAEAVGVADRGVETHRTVPINGFTWRPNIHAWARAFALTGTGRLAEAEDELSAAYDRALSDGSLRTEPYLPWQMAVVTRTQGRVAASERWAREAVSLLRRRESPGYLLCFALAELAHSLALSGRGDEAAELLVEIDSSPAETLAMFPASIAGARAWTAVAQGNLEGAMSTLRKAADDASAAGARGLEMIALHDLARLGDVAGVARRVGDLATHLDGSLARARVDHVRALASRDPAELDSVSRSFEAMGAMPLAAEAAAEAAAARRRLGGAKSAGAAERRAVALSTCCQSAITPAPASTVNSVLSAREREIARLAGSGLTSRAIAGRLFLSVRTVENHLQRAYEKLGVSSRAELRGLRDI